MPNSRLFCRVAIGMAIAALFPGSRSTAADVNYFPDDTELVVSLNLKQIFSAEVVKAQPDAVGELREVLGQFAGVDLVQKYLKAASLDAFRELTRITYVYTGSKKPEVSFLVLEGAFDAGKLRDSAKVAGASLRGRKSGDHTVYEVTPRGEKRFYAVLVNPSTLLAATTGEALADALGRTGGSKKSGLKKEMSNLLESTDERQSVTFVSTGPAFASFVEGFSLPNAESAVAFSQTLDAMSGGITLTRGIQFQLAVNAGSVETAKKLTDSANSGLLLVATLARQNAEKDAKYLPVVDVVKSLRFTNQGSGILFRGEVSLATLEKLIANFPRNPLPAAAQPDTPASSGRFPSAGNDDAWAKLPRENPPLPPWARVLVNPLPRTTAKMLELDYFHREKNPLGPELAALLRWTAADALGSDFGKATAVLDLSRAGAPARVLADPGDTAALAPNMRVAVAFARKLTQEGHAITDEEFAELLKLYGPEKVTAIVHSVAYANFHNRIVLGLGAVGQRVPPVAATFSPDRLAKVPTPPRPPWDDLKAVKAGSLSVRVEWSKADADALNRTLERQKARGLRIPLPDLARIKSLPTKEREQAERVVWTRVSAGYQPEMPRVWFAALYTYYDEAKVDRVFTNSVFWVVTRTNDCFY